MNAMTSIAPSAAVQIMIVNTRDEYSHRNPISEGAVALALWIDEHGETDRASALVTALGGWNSVQRMIADDITPGLDLGEQLGRFTDGAVTAKLWNRPYAGTLAVQAAPGSLHAHDEDEAIALAPRAGLLACLSGRQGETIPGPLYHAVADPIVPNEFAVIGFGQGTVFDVPRARAMRAALADGLAQIGADA